MSTYKEQPVKFHRVTEYGNDTGYFENKWFEVRIGVTVSGRGDPLKDAISFCESAETICKDIVEE